MLEVHIRNEKCVTNCRLEMYFLKLGIAQREHKVIFLNSFGHLFHLNFKHFKFR